MYARLDTTYASADIATMTFDKISKCLAPRYLTNMKAGHTQEALAIGADMAGAIDSALTWQKRDDAAELAVIYQTHEKELALEESRQQTSIFRILFLAAAIIIILIVWILVRTHRYNRAFTEKNRRLYKLLTPDPSPKGRGVDGEASLTTPLSFGEGQGERLYHRLCELMEDPAVYTDAGCNHETLARLAGTNYHYVYDALSECANTTPADFINLYRIRHAALLLATTDDPVGLIVEQCGITNRSTFARLFREHYSMTPTEYRRAAKEK